MIVQKKKFVELAPEGDVEAADRHYVDIHFRFAATTFRDVEAVRAYHSNRAVGRFDLLGGFDEQPDAWRFVVTQWEEDDESTHSVGWLDERIRNLFFTDRRGHIAGVQSWEVDEETVIDRRSGQLSSVKYLVRYPSAQFGPAASFEARYGSHHLPELIAAAEKAEGLRLLLTNRVAREAETRTRADGHTEYSGAYLDEPSMLRFEELWFDSELAADRFFRSEPVLALLRDGPCGRVSGYRVEEHCGIDRR